MRNNNAAFVNKTAKKEQVRIVAKAVPGARKRARAASVRNRRGTVEVVLNPEDMPIELYATCAVLAKKHRTGLATEMENLIARSVEPVRKVLEQGRKRTKRRLKAVSVR